MIRSGLLWEMRILSDTSIPVVLVPLSSFPFYWCCGKTLQRFSVKASSFLTADKKNEKLEMRWFITSAIVCLREAKSKMRAINCFISSFILFGRLLLNGDIIKQCVFARRGCLKVKSSFSCFLSACKLPVFPRGDGKHFEENNLYFQKVYRNPSFTPSICEKTLSSLTEYRFACRLLLHLLD